MGTQLSAEAEPTDAINEPLLHKLHLGSWQSADAFFLSTNFEALPIRLITSSNKPFRYNKPKAWRFHAWKRLRKDTGEHKPSPSSALDWYVFDRVCHCTPHWTSTCHVLWCPSHVASSAALEVCHMLVIAMFFQAHLSLQSISNYTAILWVLPLN